MESKYHYFKRDISWLSFNHRVLLEADDDSLPLYERINFVSIYSSNLEEFYKIRVAEHKAIASGGHSDDITQEEAKHLIHQITEVVNEQMEDRIRIYERKLIPALREQQHVVFYQSKQEVEPVHTEFIRNFFKEEIFPYLQPVPVCKNRIKTFLRDNRLYLSVRVIRRDTGEKEYYIIKLPYSKVPRFIEPPRVGEYFYLMYMEDIIKANIDRMFPGYELDCSYCCKISRDADIFVDDAESSEKMVEQLKKKVKKRKIGALSRFMYDQAMPDDFLAFVCDAFGITSEDLVLGGRYNNLQDLMKLPNPAGKHLEQQPPVPMRVPFLDEMGSVFKAVKKRDILLHFPYESFDYLIRFLMEAAFDPKVDEIKITQYRVAENSAVINTLVSAAQNGKKVTVFVELKARFDEENNMSTAERMEQAGIRIIYSIPGLKVHAKVAVILRKDTSEGLKRRDFAYLSTGNFNEKTAKIYSDMALLTSNTEIITDINKVFAVLEGRMKEPTFRHLLVARFNMVSELTGRIRREIEHVREGRKGRIILKMNGLHDQHMIEELYHASEAGVEIDLIVRGICCLVPNQPYSANIRVTRIVDMFLEHSRVWYFLNDGQEDLFLTSADWMRRNLNRRIETAFPILDPDLKREIIDILNIQLSDNVKACYLDGELRNNFKCDDNPVKVRSQLAIYDYLRNKSIR